MTYAVRTETRETDTMFGVVKVKVAILEIADKNAKETKSRRLFDSLNEAKYAAIAFNNAQRDALREVTNDLYVTRTHNLENATTPGSTKS